MLSDLNTSHVKVKQNVQPVPHIKEIHLNTSHVKVKHSFDRLVF